MGVRARKISPPSKVKRTRSRRKLFLNAALASFAFVIGVWLQFYVDRIPVAQKVQGEHVVAEPGSTVVLSGLGAGPLLSINLRTGGRLRVSVDEGAEIVSPAPAQLSAAPATQPLSGLADRMILDMFKSDRGNAGFDFELRGDRPMAVVVVPVPTENGRNGFRITPRGGTLFLHALIIPGGDGNPGQMTLMAAARITRWDEALIAIPSGKTAEILADDPADGIERATVIELPSYSRADPVATGTLMVASVTVGGTDAQSSNIVMCGASKLGQKRFWPPIFPTLSLPECVPGKLAVSAFDPFGAVSFNAKGTAFMVRDGRPELWKGPSLFIANPLVSKALQAALIAPLLAWLGFSIRALWTRRRRS